MTTTSPPHPLWLRAQQPLGDTHAVVTARAWLASDSWALVLLGDVGRGKSQAAAWLWDRLRDEDTAHAQRPGVAMPRGGVMWLRPRVLDRMEWGDRARLLAECATAYGLVIDEIGAEGDNAKGAISDVLEDRGDRLARTVVTTNLPAADFARRYGARVVSRLRAGGLDDAGLPRWVVTVRGPDIRGKVTLAQEPTETPGEPLTPDAAEAILREELPDGLPDSEAAAPLVRLVRGDRA